MRLKLFALPENENVPNANKNMGRNIKGKHKPLMKMALVITS